jgi:hypothetical protein
MRYWYSRFGGNVFANGWCFGETPDAARDNALADMARRTPRADGPRLTLQSSPNYGDDTPVEYFDYKL